MFNRNLKLYFALVFIYLALSIEIHALNASVKLSGRFYSNKKLTRKNGEKDPTKTIAFNNPLASLGYGFSIGLGIDHKIFNCFPDTAFKDLSEEEIEIKKENKELNENFSPFIVILKKLADFALKLFDNFCSKRKEIVEFVENNVISKPKKYRLFAPGFPSRYQKITRRHKPMSEIIEEAKVKIGSLKETVVNISDKIINVKDEIVESTVGKFFIEIFENNKNKLFEYVEKVRSFLFSGIMNRLIDCVLATKSVVDNTMDIFEGLRSKFKSLKSALKLGKVGLVIWIVDFVIALLCDYAKFKEALDIFMKSLNYKNIFTKMFFIGKSIGTIYNAYALADTYSGVIIDKLLSKKN